MNTNQKQSGGGGGPVVRAKARARAEFIAALPPGSNIISRLPKALQWTAHAGTPHLPMTQERCDRFLKHLAATGNYAAAARLTDGNDHKNAAARFRSHAVRDPAFGKSCRQALDEFGSLVSEAIRQEAIEGVLEPIVSMGNIVAHVKRRDTKLLALVARKHDADFARANSAGGVNVNVGVNLNGLTAVDDPANPSVTIHLAETWPLPLADRAHLSRIFNAILTRRNQGELTQIDLTPPPDLLELEAEEEAKVAEENQDDPWLKEGFES